jgi:alcohol dehydrogenase class IV
MKAFDFNLPGKIKFGEGIVSSIGSELANKNIKKVMIVTDKGIVSANLHKPILDSLEESNIKVILFDSVEANPGTGVVNEGAKKYASNQCEALIAIGGGSSIDCAKAIGIAVNNGGALEDYMGFGKVSKPIPFMIAVPTTYGTGSEVSTATIVTNQKEKFKMFIGSDLIAPNVAYLDPKLLVALPFKIAATTGMDALTHAIESYISKNANPVSDALNEYAISAIYNNILPAATTSDDMEATSNMVMASCMTAMAFNYTALGLVHAIAHSLGGLYNIAHGMANAVLLPYVMEFNMTSKPEKFAMIASLMQEDTYGLSDIDAAYLSIEAVRKLSGILDIPEKLSQIGIKESDFSTIVEHVFMDGNIGFNPRTVKDTDVLSILKKAI